MNEGRARVNGVDIVWVGDLVEAGRSSGLGSVIRCWKDGVPRLGRIRKGAGDEPQIEKVFTRSCHKQTSSLH